MSADQQAFEAAVKNFARRRAELPEALFAKAIVPEVARAPNFDKLEILPESATCTLCGDTGWKISADNGAGTAAKCECRIKSYDGPESIPAADLEAYGCAKMVSRELRSSWNSGLGPWPPEADCWPGRYTHDGDRPKWLLVHGDVGTGKSRVAAWIMRRAMARGASCWWLDVPNTIKTFRDAIGLDSAQLSLNTKMDAILSRQLVILDDVRARGDSAWQVHDLLANWIRMRHESGGWTAVTTNLSPAALRDLDASMASRITSGPVVEMTGSDARRKEWRVWNADKEIRG